MHCFTSIQSNPIQVMQIKSLRFGFSERVDEKQIQRLPLIYGQLAAHLLAARRLLPITCRCRCPNLRASAIHYRALCRGHRCAVTAADNVTGSVDRCASRPLAQFVSRTLLGG